MVLALTFNMGLSFRGLLKVLNCLLVVEGGFGGFSFFGACEFLGSFGLCWFLLTDEFAGLVFY